MDRNVEIENRINKIKNYDRLHNINSYGGFRLSGLPEHMQNHLKKIDLDISYYTMHYY